MDVITNLLSGMLTGTWLVLFVIIGIGLIASLVGRSSWFKGWLGEVILGMHLWFWLPQKKYKVIHDVMLPTEDGTTQIDHIVVSRFGIFVIETKNMKGWIFGSEHEAMWKQTFPKKKNQFQNPLHQNYKHTRTLCDVLQLPKEIVHSVVVFVGQSTFKTDMPSHVTRPSGCVDFIRSKREEVLDEVGVSNVEQALRDNRIASTFANKRAHNRHVKDIKAGKCQE